MQISGSFIRPATQLPVDQQAVRDRASNQHGHALQPSTGTYESNLTLRAVDDARKAESLLFRGRFSQTAYDAQNTTDPRSQRALNAYASLEQNAEREYVSSVLGIDEYV